MIKCTRLKLADHVARMEEGRSALKILRGKPLGRPKCKWKDNVIMDLKSIGINTKIWFGSVQGRDYCRALVNEALKLRIPQAMELVS